MASQAPQLSSHGPEWIAFFFERVESILGRANSDDYLRIRAIDLFDLASCANSAGGLNGAEVLVYFVTWLQETTESQDEKQFSSRDLGEMLRLFMEANPDMASPRDGAEAEHRLIWPDRME